MLGQDDIVYGKDTGMKSFATVIKQVLAVIQSSKDQTTLISSLFNVWEENILSLGEGMQEELGMMLNQKQFTKILTIPSTFFDQCKERGVPFRVLYGGVITSLTDFRLKYLNFRFLFHTSYSLEVLFFKPERGVP